MTTETTDRSPLGAWPTSIYAITIFVEDLETTRDFYRTVFGLPVVFEGPTSAVFKFGETLVNLLHVASAPELVDPTPVAGRDSGVRHVFTVHVEDVDGMCAALASRGVEFLNGPMDRPWGIRTASFRDPAGHIWEVAR